MACPSTTTLSDTMFNNTCVVLNSGFNATVHSAMQSCCHSADILTVETGCYSYCNITAPADGFWTFCLTENLDAQTFGSLDTSCFGNFDNGKGSAPASTALDGIASTSTTPDATLTMTSASGESAISTGLLSASDLATLAANTTSTATNGSLPTISTSPIAANTSLAAAGNGTHPTGLPSSVSSLGLTSSIFSIPTAATSSPSPTKSHSKAALGLPVPTMGLTVLNMLLGLIAGKLLVGAAYMLS